MIRRPPRSTRTDTLLPYTTLVRSGVAHAVLLWPGDILHSYAVAALILLAFGEMSDRKRLWLGIAIYTGVVLLSLLIGGMLSVLPSEAHEGLVEASGPTQIGSASCREGVCQSV